MTKRSYGLSAFLFKITLEISKKSQAQPGFFNEPLRLWHQSFS